MNLNLNQALVTKMTIKKIISQIDQVEALLAYGSPGADIKMVLADWFTEMRVHLRRVEYMTEQAVR